MNSKIAQRRGLLSGLKEKFHPSGILETGLPFFGSKDFKEKMKNIRDTDKVIREKASYLKSYLDQAQSNFEKKEYFLTFAPLMSFYKESYEIADKLEELKEKTNWQHWDFLAEHMSDDKLDQLEEIEKELTEARKNKQNRKNKKANLNQDIVKTAGVMDWIFNKRYRALSTWEKRFPNFVKTLKESIYNSLEEGKSLLQDLLAQLKIMDSSLINRNPENYFLASANYLTAFYKFEKNYNKLLSSHIRPIRESLAKSRSNRTDSRPKSDTLEGAMEEFKSNQEDSSAVEQSSLDTYKEEASKYSEPAKTQQIPAALPISEKIEVSKNDIAPPSNKEEISKYISTNIPLAQAPVIKNPIKSPTFEDIKNKEMGDYAKEEAQTLRKLKNKDDYADEEEPATLKKDKQSSSPESQADPASSVMDLKSPDLKFEDEEESPQTLRSSVLEQSSKEDKPSETIRGVAPPPKTSHVNFINKIEKMANAPVSDIALEILKYSQAIEENELQTSLKLISLIENLSKEE